MQHSFEQIEELLGLFGAVPAGRPWMSIGQVDDYVAGIAVCPEVIAPDLIPTFVQTLKRWSAWRGGAAYTAVAAAGGCKVIPFRRRTGGADAP